MGLALQHKELHAAQLPLRPDLFHGNTAPPSARCPSAPQHSPAPAGAQPPANLVGRVDGHRQGGLQLQAPHALDGVGHPDRGDGDVAGACGGGGGQAGRTRHGISRETRQALATQAGATRRRPQPPALRCSPAGTAGRAARAAGGRWQQARAEAGARAGQPSPMPMSLFRISWARITDGRLSSGSPMPMNTTFDTRCSEGGGGGRAVQDKGGRPGKRADQGHGWIARNRGGAGGRGGRQGCRHQGGHEPQGRAGGQGWQ